MDTLLHVPPGFRFHPTDEELVDYYLRRKVASKTIDFDVVKDVDLYKIEPWDLQEKCRIGTEEQSEWYFFSHKDKKYPTGTRTNRATTAGFWKATGRDKAIYSKHNLIGMRKTLVFYMGRAPNGQKSDWIMHEYRLETNELGPPQAKGWVVCRVFKKRTTTVKRASDLESPCWYDDQVSFIHEIGSSPRRILQQEILYQPPFPCKQELDNHYSLPQEPFLQLPQLQSPTLPHSGSSNTSGLGFGFDINQRASPQMVSYEHQQQSHMSLLYDNGANQAVDQVTDWRVLDKFVASQLSQEDASEGTNFTDAAGFHLPDMNLLQQANDPEAQECPLPGTSSCQVELWKQQM
ncbi:NAC domain-containing protein 7 [Nymphaea colorata]|nr:NAC domain-containing protein 7 [Nymphaea colorata]